MKGSVLQDCPPLQMPGCYLCFWPGSYKLYVWTTPFSGLINFLEQVTELKKSVYSFDYCFIAKIRINSQMEKYIGQGPEWRGFSPHGAWGLPGDTWKWSGSPAWKPSQRGSRHCPPGFLWRLHYAVVIAQVIGHWQLNSASSHSFLPGVEVGLKITNFQSCVWFTWQPAPILEWSPRVISLTQ